MALLPRPVRRVALPALLLAVAANLARAADESALASARERVNAEIAALHFEHIEPARREAMISDVAAWITGGEKEIGNRLHDRLIVELFSFAPPRPAPNSLVLYRTPYDGSVPSIILQGVGPEAPTPARTHSGRHRHAWDFSLPIGTTVFAARSGVVRRVIDGLGPSRTGKLDSLRTNVVIVLHGDGSLAVYAHLQSGIPVREGQTVGVGQPIGRSGNSGLAGFPHLHFSVGMNPGDGYFQSIPIRFGIPGQPGFEPRETQMLVPPIPAAAELRVSVNGRRASGDTPVRVLAGSVPEIRVERVAGSGPPVDVTRDATLRFAAGTPWSVSVRGGRVSMTPTEGFDVPGVKEEKLVRAIVFVTHGPPGAPPDASAVVYLEPPPAGR